VVAINTAIGKNKDVAAGFNRHIGCRKKCLQTSLHSRRAACHWKEQRQCCRLEAGPVYLAQFFQLLIAEERVIKLDPPCIKCCRFQQVPFRADQGNG